MSGANLARTSVVVPWREGVWARNSRRNFRRRVYFDEIGHEELIKISAEFPMSYSCEIVNTVLLCIASGVMPENGLSVRHVFMVVLVLHYFGFEGTLQIYVLSYLQKHSRLTDRLFLAEAVRRLDRFSNDPMFQISIKTMGLRFNEALRGMMRDIFHETYIERFAWKTVFCHSVNRKCFMCGLSMWVDTAYLRNNERFFQGEDFSEYFHGQLGPSGQNDWARRMPCCKAPVCIACLVHLLAREDSKPRNMPCCPIQYQWFPSHRCYILVELARRDFGDKYLKVLTGDSGLKKEPGLWVLNGTIKQIALKPYYFTSKEFIEDFPVAAWFLDLTLWRPWFAE